MSIDGWAATRPSRTKGKPAVTTCAMPRRSSMRCTRGWPARYASTRITRKPRIPLMTPRASGVATARTSAARSTAAPYQLLGLVEKQRQRELRPLARGAPEGAALRLVRHVVVASLEAEARGGGVEDGGDRVGVGPLAAAAHAEAGIVDLAAARVAHAREDLVRGEREGVAD